jgi:hypothetical protein
MPPRPIPDGDRPVPDPILERGVGAADELPTELTYAGFSLGVMPAQKLAQNRPSIEERRSGYVGGR